MTIRSVVALGIVLCLPCGAAAQSATAARRDDTLTLSAALRMAREHNRELSGARLGVEQAAAALATARTRRLPVFETEVTASQLLSPVGFSFPQGAFGTFPGIGAVPAADTTLTVPRRPTLYVSSQISQPLTQLTRIGLGIKNASAALGIERERLRARALSVDNNVKRLYFAILQTESARTSTAQAITLYRELDRTLQVRVVQKTALRGDALDVQAKLAQEELTFTIQENTLASQKEQLNLLLGRDVHEPFDVDREPPPAPAGVELTAAERQALDTRPDVREARLRLEQAELDRRITQAGRIPDVSLAVSYTSNLNIDVLPTNLAAAAVRVEWEPFDWGRRRRDVASRTQAVEQARLAVRDAEDRARVEVAARFRAVAEKRALLTVVRATRSAAEERLRVATARFETQSALLPDVLQRRAELAEADDRLQRALAEFWTARADFDLAIGEDAQQ